MNLLFTLEVDAGHVIEVVFVWFIHCTLFSLFILYSLSLYIYESENEGCSVVTNSGTPWTVTCQALLSMEFPRQEYWSE